MGVGGCVVAANQRRASRQNSPRLLSPAGSTEYGVLDGHHTLDQVWKAMHPQTVLNSRDRLLLMRSSSFQSQASGDSGGSDADVVSLDAHAYLGSPVQGAPHGKS
jgi:hypothetical protein